MSNKKKPAHGIGQIVRGDILPTIEIDCSDAISNPEEWTRGPVRPVAAVPTQDKRQQANRKKRPRRYHSLGIDPATIVEDRQKRPIRIIDQGRAIRELF